MGHLERDGFVKTRTALEFQSRADLEHVNPLGTYRKDRLTIVLLALKPGATAVSDPSRMAAAVHGIEITGFDQGCFRHPSATVLRQFASTVRGINRQ